MPKSESPATIAYKAFPPLTYEQLMGMNRTEFSAHFAELKRLEAAHIASLPWWRRALGALLGGPR